MYITDGDWDKNTAINSFNMLRQDYITTEAVIVGIGYGERPNRRDKDLEPAKGGRGFLTFIEKEVIPFIEGKYRVQMTEHYPVIPMVAHLRPTFCLTGPVCLTLFA